jgi:hypothetical protein
LIEKAVLYLINLGLFSIMFHDSCSVK